MDQLAQHPTPHARDARSSAERVELWWIPLGAGGSPLVRVSGRVYEWLAARRDHRRPRPLFHAALVVHHDGRRWTVEMAPAWQGTGDRGVVASGPVGHPVLGRSRWFRYEVRCWPDGTIPDLAAARGGPSRVATDADRVARLLAALADVPRLTWGRDERHLGEMWNSNSIVAWALVRSGHDVVELRPPDDGRAPGWQPGVDLAARRRPGAADAGVSAHPAPAGALEREPRPDPVRDRGEDGR